MRFRFWRRCGMNEGCSGGLFTLNVSREGQAGRYVARR